jgi:hypothetical protein
MTNDFPNGFLFDLSQDFTKALLRPRIKVGNEYTIQGRTVEQVRFYPAMSA